MSGEDARVIHAQALPRDASAVVGAEDLAFSRRPTSTAAATTADSKDRFDAGIGSVAGLALMLAAAGAAIVVHHSRKAGCRPRSSQAQVAARRGPWGNHGVPDTEGGIRTRDPPFGRYAISSRAP